MGVRSKFLIGLASMGLVAVTFKDTIKDAVKDAVKASDPTTQQQVINQLFYAQAAGILPEGAASKITTELFLEEDASQAAQDSTKQGPKPN